MDGFTGGIFSRSPDKLTAISATEILQGTTMLAEILLTYGSGIACSAIVDAVTEWKRNKDASLSAAANEIRSNAELHKSLAHLITPLVEEVFENFSIKKELYELLLTNSAREAVRYELTRQAISQGWSGEGLAASIPATERIGIEADVSEFAALLVRATSRSLSQNQERWNESVGFALSGIQSQLNRMEGKLDRLLEFHQKPLLKPAGDLQGLQIPKIPVSVLSDHYGRDFKRLHEFTTSRDHQIVLKESERLLDEIEIDQKYLDPRLKAAVLTCRADSLLRTGEVTDAERAFESAYQVSRDPDTSFNYLISLIRQKRWSEAEQIFEENAPKADIPFSWLIAKAGLDWNRGDLKEAEHSVTLMQVESANELLSLAEFRFQNNDFKEVERLAELALLKETDNSYAKFYLGLGLGYPILEVPSEVASFAEEARARRSIQLLGEALEDFRSKGEKLFCSFIYETLANLLLRVRDGSEAINILEKGLGDYPDSVSLLDRKYRFLTVGDHFEEAVVVARNLLNLEDTPEAHLREPWVWVFAKNYTAATAALEIALTKCPKVLEERDYVLLSGMSFANLPTPDFVRALEVLDSGIRTLPDSVELLLLRARIHQMHGNRAEAQNDLSSALSLSTEPAVAREAARVYGRLQSWPLAHNVLTRAPIQGGMDPDLVLALDSALSTDRYGEVERLIELADPDHPEKWTIRGIEADFFARTGNLKEALRVLGELSANGLTAKDARINIASALGKVGKFAEAFEILRPCLILPISPDFPRLAGQLQLSLNDPTRALQYLVQAYRMDPNDSDTRRVFLVAVKAKRSLGGGLTLGEDTILKEIQGR